MVDDMEKLKKLGFKKIKTEPGFHMFELNPATLRAPQTAERPSAQARKRTSDTKAFGRHQAHKLDK
jgi:hypothetical protein